jgi:hypothetical protein
MTQFNRKPLTEAEQEEILHLEVHYYNQRQRKYNALWSTPVDEENALAELREIEERGYASLPFYTGRPSEEELDYSYACTNEFQRLKKAIADAEADLIRDKASGYCTMIEGVLERRAKRFKEKEARISALISELNSFQKLCQQTG